MSVPPTALVGKQLGRYLLKDVLGIGGMGVVYAAYDPTLDRRVALKLLRADKHVSERAKQRLVREARAMAKLSHPNVISVHEIGSAGGRDFVVMELIQGVSMAEWLKGASPDRNAPPASSRAWHEVLAVFLRAGRGLAAAHSAGLIHRDFKPANVLLGKDGRVVVTDFGLARLDDTRSDEDSEDTPLEADPALTLPGAVMGTPIYMAPEQHNGEHTDARTDQFNFCASLYHALYGQRPFPGDSVDDVRQAVIGGQINAEPLGSSVPRRVRQVLRRGLSTAPDARFSSMEELLAALEQAGARRQAPRLAAPVLGGLVAAAAIAAGVLVLGSGQEAPTSALAPATSLPADPELRAKLTALATELDAIDQEIHQGRIYTVHERAQTALTDARASGFQPLIAKALLLVGKSMPDARLGDALPMFEEAAALGEASGDSALRAFALSWAAIWQYRMDDDLNAHRIAVQRATAAAARHPQDKRLQYLASANQGLLAFAERRMDDGVKLITRAIVLAEEQGDLYETMSLKLLAATWLTKVDAEQSRELVGDIISHVSSPKGAQLDPLLANQWLAQSADILAGLGDEEQASAVRHSIAEAPAGDPQGVSKPRRAVSGRAHHAHDRGDGDITVAIAVELAQSTRSALLGSEGYGLRTAPVSPDGRFEFRELGDEAMVLLAYSAGSRSRPVRITEGGDQQDIELILERAGTVRGQVVLATSADESVRIFLRPADELLYNMYHIEAESTAEGRFTANDIPPGHYYINQLVVFKNAFEDRILGTVEVEAGRTAGVMLNPRQGPSELVVTIKSSLHGQKTQAATVALLPGTHLDMTYRDAFRAALREPLRAPSAVLVPAYWADSNAAPTQELHHRFRGLHSGPMTICVLEYTNIKTLWEVVRQFTKIERHGDAIKLACTPVTIPPSGEIAVTVESAPLKRLPDN